LVPLTQKPSIPSGSSAADFSLTDIDGNKFSLSDFSGKVVVLEFMSTTCKFCKLQTDALKRIWDKHYKSLVIVSVSVDPIHDKDEVLRQYREENEVGWIMARDMSSVSGTYEVVELPTLFVIGEEGQLYSKYLGLTSYDILSKDVDVLLG